MAPPLPVPRLEPRQVVLGGAVGAACMAAGAYVYAPMPTIPAPLNLLPIAALRASSAGRPWGLALCFAGVVILSLAWIALGLGVRGRRAGVGSVRIGVLAWSVPLLLAPPLFSGDGWSYVAYGYLTGHRLSPYTVTPSVLHEPIVDAVCSCWRSTPAPYGPLPLLWGGAFSRLTSSPWLLLESYRLLALVGLALLLVAVPRLARSAGRDPATATWLAASPFLLAHGVGGVHLDLLVIGLVAVSLLLTHERIGPNAWLAGSVGVGLAAAVKAPAAVAIVGVLLLALRPGSTPLVRARTTALAGATVIATTALVGALGGLGMGWLSTLHVALALHTPLSATYDVAAWTHALTGYAVEPWVDLVSLVVVAICCGLLVWRTPAGDPSRALRAVGVAMLLTTVLSPVTNYWYYLWCLPLLACCLLPSRAERCLVAGTVALGLLAPLDPGLGLPGTGWVQLAAVLGALALALGHPLLPRRSASVS